MVVFLGYLAGFVAMISFVPQVIRTLRRKSARDISLPMLLLTLLTNLLYVAYGIALQLLPVVVMLGIMSAIIVLQIGLTLKYRKRI